MAELWLTRPATLADAPVIAEAERVCFGDPWSAAGIAELFENEAVAARVVTGPGPEIRLAGYAFARVIAGEAEILNIAVLPPYRRMGVGRLLLDSVLAAVAAGGAIEAFLEVRESNAAARFLYETRGFRAVGFRADYYRKPRENAVIMRSDIGVVVK